MNTKTKFVIAVDTEKMKLIAFTDYLSKNQEHEIESFAATAHSKTVNNFLVLDASARGFTIEAFTAEGVMSILQDAKIHVPTGAHGVDSLVQLLVHWLTDAKEESNKLYIPLSKFKDPSKTRGFISNATTKEHTMPETETKATKSAAKKASKKVTKKAPAKKAAEKAPAKKRVEKAILSNGQRSERPAPGGKTVVVWEIADKNFRKTRQEILELCKEAGVADATAATQYGRWRRERLVEGKQVGPAKKK